MEYNKLQNKLYEFLNGTPKKEAVNGQAEEFEREKFHAALRQLDELSRKDCRPDRKRMWKNVHQHVVVTRRRLLIRRWSRIAAVVIPAIFATVLFLYFQSSHSLVEPLSPTVIARNQVQLLLNDGRVVQVQQLERDSILEEKGTGIRIDTNQSIVYTVKNREKAELVYNTLTVPRCCEYHLVLADGTRVWLNSDSELRFPVDFVGEERRVFLKGEAYFQVAKNAEKPFRVEAGAIQIEALGTGFDVSAYREDGKWMTTLVDGSVRVSDLGSQQQSVLVPGEQARLQDGVLVTEKVNVSEIIGWKEGRFVFSDLPLEEIAHQLERWYDVEIDFQDVVVKYYRFTGVMKRYNQLSQLIELIEETTDVKFQVNGRQVTICRR